jgi:DNA-binding NarL/FixJ family response regulator
MISVVLADDQAVVRMGLRVLVDRERDMQVVGEAGDGREALDRVRETHPDVLLLDIRMPGMDGLETLSAISADGKLADTRVIVVTTFEIDEYVFRALQAGASGFILKDTAPAELVRAIRVVAGGEALLSPSPGDQGDDHAHHLDPGADGHPRAVLADQIGRPATRQEPDDEEQRDQHANDRRPPPWGQPHEQGPRDQDDHPRGRVDREIDPDARRIPIPRAPATRPATVTARGPDNLLRTLIGSPSTVTPQCSADRGHQVVSVTAALRIRRSAYTATPGGPRADRVP